MDTGDHTRVQSSAMLRHRYRHMFHGAILVVVVLLALIAAVWGASGPASTSDVFSIGVAPRDTVIGARVPNITCELFKQVGSKSRSRWQILDSKPTGAEGFVDFVLQDSNSAVGTVFKVVVQTETYYTRVRGLSTFYPNIALIFERLDDENYLSLPILMSPYSYSSYRGRRQTIF